jgi:multiple sugar transport system substrate-binding protein
LAATGRVLGFAALAFAGVFLTGCRGKVEAGALKTVELTMWHNYSGQMKSTLDELIAQFNETVGKENGVSVSVTYEGTSTTLSEKLTELAAQDRALPDIPDLMTVYPKMAMTLADAGLLATLDGRFDAKELEAYQDSYIEEGRLQDGKLYVFPVAKSTEVLYVNRTLFDRFSAATGVGLDNLSTFRGIADAAEMYYEWTDAQTPEVEGDGKAFFSCDSWFTVTLVGFAQQGYDFVDDTGIHKDGDLYRRIWEFAMPPGLRGEFAVVDTFSSALANQGDVVCSIASTASVRYYSHTVTYPDGQTEEVEYDVLPYPVFVMFGGKQMALQRGAGIAVAKTSDRREQAAALFLKWFTQPEQNKRFVSGSGYLPVTNAAFQEMVAVAAADQAPGDDVYDELYATVRKMYQEYLFLYTPNVDNVSAMMEEYEKDLKDATGKGRDAVRNGADVELVSEALLRDIQD